jgi:UDP-3-O-[3-hydroxymyristoyl] glucosamine N-acyltransferase
MKLSKIAEVLGAQLEGVSGEEEITGVCGIEQAGAGQITFVSNQKYASQVKQSQAAAILVAPDFQAVGKPVLRVANPYLAFARALELFYQPPVYAPGVHPTAVVAPSAKLGRGVHIGAYVVIDEDVEIGDGSVLLPHVTIYRGAKMGKRFLAHAHAVVREFCRIGDDVTLQNGVVIGADGFGFAHDGAHWHKIVQSGITVLEDGVEVQSLSSVDRASIGETRIGAGTKIDNLVQVGHGSTVGQTTMLCSQVGLAGSTHVGNNVILAGQVGVAGHCKIGDGVIATAQSGIPSNVEAGSVVSGYPAMENKQWLRASAVFARLPELARTLRRLAKREEGGE